MADTKTTTRGATGYTPWHGHTSVTTYNVDSNLNVRSGPGTGYGYSEPHRIYPGSWWTIAEELWGWCRQPSCDRWTSGDFTSPRYTTAPSPGEFRVDSIKVTATRNQPSDKNLTVTYEIKCSNAAGTTETYYDWRVYCYAAKINGGEVHGDLYNRSKSIGANGSWTKTLSYTIEETSTNSSVTLGNYGIWYQGNGPFTSRDGGVGSQLSFDIPPYNPVTPPTCTAINTSDRTETSIKLSGTFNANNGTIDKYRFKYRKDDTASWTELNETTSNSASLSSLTPNTKYWLGAKAHNEAGWGNYKEDVSFFTKPKANKPTVSASDIKYNSFKITVTKNSTNYPDINYYGASYRKDGTSSWTNFSNQASNEFTASNLLPNTKYYIKGKTRTKTGLDGSTAWSVDSDEVVVYTKPKAGTSTIACVRNNTTNSLNIKVTPVGNTSNASTSTYVPSANTYQVRYRVSGTANWTESGTSTNQTITLSSLTANSNYEIQGRSRTGVGIDGTSTAWSNWSNSITVRVVRKATINTVEYNNINNSTKINLTITYQNDYPAANRIYYAVVPQTISSNPGKISGMYFSTTGSPCTINIVKDYQGNALLPNTKYYVWIYVNQYKSASDWYTAGLDLYSDVEMLPIVTQPDIGTLKDIKCVQNNTYNSLTFSATKNGTWSKYAGWEYRYKKTSELDSNYSYWSGNPNTNNKTISNLTEGESYDIQIRGSTGTVNDSMTYYSQTYKLTVRVVRKPKITIELVRLKENEIGIKGIITDKGYPEVTRLDWQYSSNSFITLTYVPGTWNTFKTINFGSSITTSQNCTFTNLYHFAMYNVRAKLTQYKTGSQWYTAGLNHSFDFDINNIELAMYNSRTSRLRANNSGWKQVKNLKTWNGTTWVDAGNNINSPSGTTKYGDVNKDGVIDTDDSNLVLKHAAHNITLNSEQLTIGDVNKDGKVDALDSVDILKYYKDGITPTGSRVGKYMASNPSIISDQIWGKSYYQDNIRITNFYKNGDLVGNNQEMIDRFEVWIPGIDRVRWKGQTTSDNAYGGNLFDNKLSIDLSTLQTSDVDHNLPYLSLDISTFEYKFNKNSISCKLKNNLTNPASLYTIFSIRGLSRVLPLSIINNVYIELCSDVIPKGDDKALTLIPHNKMISKENPNSNRAIIIYTRKNENEKFTRQLVSLPINILENLGLGYSFDSIEFFNDFRTVNSVDHSTIKIKNSGSIVNISNLNIYYTLM